MSQEPWKAGLYFSLSNQPHLTPSHQFHDYDVDFGRDALFFLFVVQMSEKTQCEILNGLGLFIDP